MITAQQALQNTRKCLENDIDMHLRYIGDVIFFRSNQGQTVVNYVMDNGGTLSRFLKESLEGLGYSVDIANHDDKHEYLAISW